MASRIKSVKFLRPFNDDEKAAPQMKAIVASAVESIGLNVPTTVDEVVKAMEGNVTSRQPLERIFAYYAPKLEEAGLVEIERSAAEPKAKKTKNGDEGSDVSGDLGDETDDDLGDDDLGDDDLGDEDDEAGAASEKEDA